VARLELGSHESSNLAPSMNAGKVSRPSPCARCHAALGRSCCEVGPGERLATLTGADVERIRSSLRLRRERFVEEEPFSPEQATQYEARRPGWRGYFRRTGVRWTLRVEGGACVFLGPGGCSLHPEVRPTACLLYPFEPGSAGFTLAVERSGSVAEARASGEPRCLAVEEALSRRGLQHLFRVDVQTLTSLRDRLQREVEAHPGCPPASRSAGLR
jgi:Fe-S-cluster containining protein